MKLNTVNKTLFSTLIGCLILLFTTSTSAQKNHYPKTDFRSPLNIPLHLAGNFGELRGNHFHSGIDIKTNGKEGYRVYAAESGYVSRIKISPWGYGTALYITHPNGYTTVYAHLQKLSGKIGEYVKAAQYKKESFEIQLYPKADELPVTKGDVVALSGNSGGSTAPHLHFEIRDNRNSHPMNVLKFGFDIKDTIAPKLKSVAIYPLDATSSVNGSSKTKWEKALPSSKGYSMNNKEIPTVHGAIGFGIEGNDYLNAEPNPCGFYSVDLFVDDVKLYSHSLDHYGFDETRYINSLIDYDRKARLGRKVQRSYLQPNNKLSIYKNLQNKGVYDFNDNNIHTIKYIVKDTYGNESVLNFKVQSISNPKQLPLKIDSSFTKKFNFDLANFHSTKDFSVNIPKGALYDNVNFSYSSSPAVKNGLSNIHHVHKRATPLHKSMTIAIAPTVEIPSKLKSKVVIVRTNKTGKIKKSEGGKWVENKMSMTTKYFGNFRLSVDTVKPTIRPINIKNGKNLSKQANIKVTMSDNIAGVKYYRATINGKWILMEYDGKKGLLTYTFDEHCPAGENEFKLVVTDGRQNTAVYKAKFVR